MRSLSSYFPPYYLVRRAACVAALTAAQVFAGETVIPENKTKLLTWADEDGREHAVGAPAEWHRRRAHILANMQAVMGPLPDVSRKVPLDVRVVTEEALPDFTRKKITFATEEGDRVPAWLLIPPGLKAGQKAPAALCLHQTTPLGKAEPVGMGLKNLAYAAELAQRGFVALAPDYPGFGDYKPDVYAMGYASASMKGIWNHIRAVDVLQALPQVDGQRIGAIGHSLGGHNALFAAVFDTRIAFVITSCGFNSFNKYMGGNLKGWSHKGYMPRIADVFGCDPARMPFDFTEVLGAIAPRPCFINAPLHDSNFDVSGVRDCVAAATPVYELLGVRDRLVAVHPDCGHDFPPEIRKAAYDFAAGDSMKRP